LLTTPQVAALLNVSVSAVNKWRLYGRGPQYMKVGRVVRYRRADIAAYLESCTRDSTSQQTAKDAA
jgi:excisionase family DNA binding protein